MEVKGKVVKILGITTGKGASAWRKQDFILETEGTYPKKVAMAVWGDKIEQFNLKEGQRITADIEIESREYNNKWYTDVKVFKLTGGINYEPDNKYAGAAPNMGVIDNDQLPW